MSDPILDAHREDPHHYVISGPAPISIRDQMLRGVTLIDRLLEAGEIGTQRALAVIGAGAGGASAAIYAAARRISTTLIERAADVCLKEGRKLVLAVRDAPFSRVHLENMLKAQAAGAVIFPIIPSFYHHPATIEDLVTQFCCRVLAHFGLEQKEQFHWEGEAEFRH